MAKDYVMNGEIYVKNGPEPFNARKYSERIDSNILDLEFETSKENPDFQLANVLEQYKDLRDHFNALDGKTDYSFTDQFFQLTTNGKEYELENCRRYEFDLKKVVVYKNKEEMEKHFTSLVDFLNIAVFVGKKFQRTKPITTLNGGFNKSFMNPIQFKSEYIVLYATQDLFLAYSLNSIIGNRYTLINSQYTLDGNYEFYGQVFNEYRDKAKVYREICEQIEQDRKWSKKK